MITFREQNKSLASFLGATKTRVASGVSVGIQNSLNDLVRVVGEYLEFVYLQVKLRTELGSDIDLVKKFHKDFGDDLLIHVVASAAYRVTDAEHLRNLDDFNLLLIEQPLSEDDLSGHIELSKNIYTAVCLATTSIQR